MKNFNMSFSALEIDKNITRQQYLGDDLGKLYKNRYGVTFFSEVYPKYIKVESISFSLFENVYIYIPLYCLLIYFGYKRSLPLRGEKKYEK